MMNNPGDRLLEGADEIGDAIKRSYDPDTDRRQVLYWLAKGYIPGARKLGRKWIASGAAIESFVRGEA